MREQYIDTAEGVWQCHAESANPSPGIQYEHGPFSAMSFHTGSIAAITGGFGTR
jgi:hypothetical protein